MAPLRCRRGRWGGRSQDLTGSRARRRGQWNSRWASDAWCPGMRQEALSGLLWACRKKWWDSHKDKSIVMGMKHHLEGLSMTGFHWQSSASWRGIGGNDKVTLPDPWSRNHWLNLGSDSRLWIFAFPMPTCPSPWVFSLGNSFTAQLPCWEFCSPQPLTSSQVLQLEIMKGLDFNTSHCPAI